MLIESKKQSSLIRKGVDHDRRLVFEKRMNAFLILTFQIGVWMAMLSAVGYCVFNFILKIK